MLAAGCLAASLLSQNEVNSRVEAPFNISVVKPWRYRDPARGSQVLRPGLYRVPEDLVEKVARRAISEGMAVAAAGPASIVATAKPAAPTPRLERVEPVWAGRTCVVAASGPSLTPDVAAMCRGLPTVVVNDAYRLFPEADVLYACDGEWWRHHGGCMGFAGERWSSHGNHQHNNKMKVAEAYGLHLVSGADAPGFSADPSRVHYAENSGFQAINLAALKLGFSGRIILVGFDMRRVAGRGHFFGEHPKGALRQTKVSSYAKWVKLFADAAKKLPTSLTIINCTPGSALTCFPQMDLTDALSSAP